MVPPTKTALSVGAAATLAGRQREAEIAAAAAVAVIPFQVALMDVFSLRPSYCAICQGAYLSTITRNAAPTEHGQEITGGASYIAGMSTEKKQVRVGFVGLGLMGGGMARNIAEAGFPLTVYNRTRQKADDLAKEISCTVAETPRAAAEASDVVITMVSDVPDVEQVYLQQGGILEAARPGLTCADMGTVGAACAKRVASALEEKQALFVDAPVSGGSWGAAQGTLSIMAGGTEEAFNACLPVFEAMGKTIVHCGPVGTGQTTKLVNQIVGALNLEAVCEGLLFAKKAGADVEKVLSAVGAGAAASWSWTNLGPRIAAGDYAPGFKIDHQIKDLRLAIEAAEEMGLSLPGTRLVLEHLRTVQARGGGEQGTQAMIRAFAGE